MKVRSMGVCRTELIANCFGVIERVASVVGSAQGGVSPG
jgi:hypothetical protein